MLEFPSSFLKQDNLIEQVNIKQQVTGKVGFGKKALQRSLGILSGLCHGQRLALAAAYDSLSLTPEL